MINDIEYIKAKQIVSQYEREQLNKPIVIKSLPSAQDLYNGYNDLRNQLGIPEYKLGDIYNFAEYVITEIKKRGNVL